MLHVTTLKKGPFVYAKCVIIAILYTRSIQYFKVNSFSTKCQIFCLIPQLMWVFILIKCAFKMCLRKSSISHLENKIADQLTKLSKIGFLWNFLQIFLHYFLAHISKLTFWVARWVLAIISKRFRHFFEISQLPKIVSLKLFSNVSGNHTFTFW